MKKGYKICPHCWKEIKSVAIKCQYCLKFLDEEPEKKTKECPFCLNEIDINEEKCPHCDEVLIKKESKLKKIFSRKEKSEKKDIVHKKTWIGKASEYCENHIWLKILIYLISIFTILSAIIWVLNMWLGFRWIRMFLPSIFVEWFSNFIDTSDFSLRRIVTVSIILILLIILLTKKRFFKFSFYTLPLSIIFIGISIYLASFTINFYKDYCEDYNCYIEKWNKEYEKWNYWKAREYFGIGARYNYLDENIDINSFIETTRKVIEINELIWIEKQEWNFPDRTLWDDWYILNLNYDYYWSIISRFLQRNDISGNEKEELYKIFFDLVNQLPKDARITKRFMAKEILENVDNSKIDIEKRIELYRILINANSDWIVYINNGWEDAYNRKSIYTEEIVKYSSYWMQIQSDIKRRNCYRWLGYDWNADFINAMPDMKICSDFISAENGKTEKDKLDIYIWWLKNIYATYYYFVEYVNGNEDRPYIYFEDYWGEANIMKEIETMINEYLKLCRSSDSCTINDKDYLRLWFACFNSLGDYEYYSYERSPLNGKCCNYRSEWMKLWYDKNWEILKAFNNYCH